MRNFPKDRVLSLVPGLTYRMLDVWTRNGHLRSPQHGQGSGSVRHWSAREVDIARLMVRLIGSAGFTVPDAAYVARTVVEGNLESIGLGHGMRLSIPRPPEGYAGHAQPESTPG